MVINNYNFKCGYKQKFNTLVGSFRFSVFLLSACGCDLRNCVRFFYTNWYQSGVSLTTIDTQNQLVLYELVAYILCSCKAKTIGNRPSYRLQQKEQITWFNESVSCKYTNYHSKKYGQCLFLCLAPTLLLDTWLRKSVRELLGPLPFLSVNKTIAW